MTDIRALIDDRLPELLGRGAPTALGLQGGFGRNSTDRHSDIDLVVVFGSRHNARDAVRGVHRDRGGQLWDLHHVYADVTDPGKWTDAQRYVYGYETQILDDDEGILRQLCAQARPDRDECRGRIAYAIRKLAQREVVYPPAGVRHWRGFTLDEVDPWLDRGDLLSAHLRLNQALELLVLLVFAVNGRPKPSGKAVYNIMQHLPWFPEALLGLFDQLAVIGKLDAAEHARRRGAARGILIEAVDEGIRRRLVVADMRAVYLRYRGEKTDSTEERKVR